MILLLTILALISATLDIVAVYNWPPAFEYIFKPLTMVFIILIAALAREPELSVYQGLIVLGLCFSLAGDVFLMLPWNLFVPGLLSFLVAHLLYAFAFMYMTGRISSLLYLIPFLLYGGVMMWVLLPEVGGVMKLPVVIYMTAILTMAWQAVNRFTVTRQTGSLIAAVGALLFVVSDSVLAINRFAKPFHESSLIVMTTYFAAQWLIAISISASLFKRHRFEPPHEPLAPAQAHDIERVTRH